MKKRRTDLGDALNFGDYDGDDVRQDTMVAECLIRISRISLDMVLQGCYYAHVRACRVTKQSLYGGSVGRCLYRGGSYM